MTDTTNLSGRSCDQLEEQVNRSHPGTGSNQSFNTTSGEFRQVAKHFKNYFAYAYLQSEDDSSCRVRLQKYIKCELIKV